MAANVAPPANGSGSETPPAPSQIPPPEALSAETPPSITLRAPSSLPSSASTSTGAAATPPDLDWIKGTWHVTHSTLPMWKKNRNVRIAYTPIPNTSPAHLDDVVTYQPIGSDKLKSVHGVDKPFDPSNISGGSTGGNESLGKASLGYNWRGKGWLMIASSKWEVIGYGKEGGADNEWVVTYFAKTMFTPAGVDLYSRSASGLAGETVQGIKGALKALGGDVEKLAGELFEVKIDESRAD